MSMRLIDEVAEFAQVRDWTLVKKPFEPIMGFLPCDALGPNVYCVYDGEIPLGYSQMGYEEALESAVFKTERWQRDRILNLERDRDSWKREAEACHAIMKKVREIWGSDTLTIDAAQGVQDRIEKLETLLERIRELQIADGADLNWAQKIAYDALSKTEAKS